MRAGGLCDLEYPAVCAVDDLVVYAVVLGFVGCLNGVYGVADDLGVGAYRLYALDKGGVFGFEGGLIHHGNAVDADGQHDILGLCHFDSVGDGDLKTGFGVYDGRDALVEQGESAAGGGPDLGAGEHVICLETVGGAVAYKDHAGDVFLSGVGCLGESRGLLLRSGSVLGAFARYVGSLNVAYVVGVFGCVVIAAASAQQAYAQTQSQCDKQCIAQFYFHKSHLIKSIFRKFCIKIFSLSNMWGNENIIA